MRMARSAPYLPQNKFLYGVETIQFMAAEALVTLGGRALTELPPRCKLEGCIRDCWRKKNGTRKEHHGPCEDTCGGFAGVKCRSGNHYCEMAPLQAVSPFEYQNRADLWRLPSLKAIFGGRPPGPGVTPDWQTAKVSSKWHALQGLGSGDHLGCPRR